MSRRKRYTRNLGRELKSPLPVRTTVEWVRFEHEDEPYGLFCYLADARERVSPEVRRHIDILAGWFEDHLDAPNVANIERFWFRGEATQHIDQARKLAALVSEAGFPIVERRTRRIPGKVKAEDHRQVAVLTFRDAPRPRRGSK